MKKIILIIAILPLFAYTQTAQEIDTIHQPMTLMSNTNQRTTARYGNLYLLKGSNEPYTGVLYGRYNNGELMTLQEYRDGIGNGIWISFNPDGTKDEQGTYVQNRVEGPVTRFWENGSVKAKGQYRHWKQPIGRWTFYDRKGNVVHIMNYTR